MDNIKFTKSETEFLTMLLEMHLDNFDDDDYNKEVIRVNKIYEKLTGKKEVFELMSD